MEIGHDIGCGCEECQAAARTVEEAREDANCKLAGTPRRAWHLLRVYRTFLDHLELLAEPCKYIQLKEIGDSLKSTIQSDRFDSTGDD